MSLSAWEYRFEGWVGRMIDWLGDDPLRRSVGPPPPVSSAPEPVIKPAKSLDDSLGAHVLRLLAESENGLTLREFGDATGATRHQLRATLKELTDAGRTRRLGAGLTTRYERID